MLIFFVDLKKFIVLIGDQQQAIDKHLSDLIKQYGEYEFAYSLDELKPFQNWLIIDNSKNQTDLQKIIENINCNVVILVRFLFQIPIELRAKCEIHL